MVWRSITRQRSSKKADKLPRLRCERPRWSLVLVGSALAVIGLARLSSVPGPGYSAQTGWLVLSWTYVSVPVEYDTLRTQLRHMRPPGVQVRRRSPVLVWVSSPWGDTLWKRLYTPGGIRGDVGVEVYAEVPVTGRFRVELADAATHLRSELFQVERGSAVVVELRGGKFLVRQR